MKTAIIVGATGLIGKQLTQLLLEDKRYSEIKLLVRRPIETQNEKLKVIIFDFDDPDTSVVTADEIFCCLGTTIKTAGSQSAFLKVDFEYVLNIARKGFENGVIKFAMISSMGASKDSRVFYNKKGQIEEAVIQIGFEGCYILRPSLLLGERSESRPGEQIGKFFMTAFSFLIPKKYKAIKAEQVAKAMIAIMNSGTKGVQVLESDLLAEINET
jgi:uncharacterized protein YbjT (DUF2867 family)